MPLGPEDPKGTISHWGFIEDCSFASNASDAEFSCNGFRTEYTDYVRIRTECLFKTLLIICLLLSYNSSGVSGGDGFGRCRYISHVGASYN